MLSETCAMSCKYQHLLGKQKHSVCFCQVIHHSPALPLAPLPPRLWYSDAIQVQERWEGLLYWPYGDRSVIPQLSLCLSRQTQRGSHTRGIEFESGPRLLPSLPFILNADKGSEWDWECWEVVRRESAGEKSKGHYGEREPGKRKGNERHLDKRERDRREGSSGKKGMQGREVKD